MTPCVFQQKIHTVFPLLSATLASVHSSGVRLNVTFSEKTSLTCLSFHTNKYMCDFWLTSLSPASRSAPQGQRTLSALFIAIYVQSLSQALAHSSLSINIGWISENVLENPSWGLLPLHALSDDFDFFNSYTNSLYLAAWMPQILTYSLSCYNNPFWQLSFSFPDLIVHQQTFTQFTFLSFLWNKWTLLKF